MLSTGEAWKAVTRTGVDDDGLTVVALNSEDCMSDDTAWVKRVVEAQVAAKAAQNGKEAKETAQANALRAAVEREWKPLLVAIRAALEAYHRLPGAVLCRLSL